ncbi:MAG: hypothetical protein BWK80_01335 [Desulfobacteraceae bacterium IS3]|nr:MAG: hypothetical protein BWK80_01335 [Desulfobacteraceae bacterium IS3]
MKRKRLLISATVAGVIALSVLLIFLMSQHSPFFKKEKVFIAVAVPVSGEAILQGQQMLRGIRLYVDGYNKQHKDRNIELIIFDDKNDKRMATKAASEIVANENVLLVIGHYSSGTSVVAGEIYKKTGMPVITASATADLITADNDWYFRTIPANRFEGGFIANYIRRSLNKDKVSIVFDKDYYGSSLVAAFEKSAEILGITVKGKWGLDTDEKNSDIEVKRIADELRAADDPGVIFMAMHGADAAKIVASLKYPGTSFTIIGSDSLATEIFPDNLKKYPGEQIIPGYHSDDIYAVSPFILDISNEKAYFFRKDFTDRYKQEPSWISAAYYDAMHIAAEAVERAEIQGVRNIRESRKLLRESLARMNSPETGIGGVCGDTYFNQYGDVAKAPAMGVYKKRLLLPAFYQYQFVSETEAQQHSFSLSHPEDIITVDEKKMERLRVVYAGVDINEISNSKTKSSTCAIDFYIWFRFEGDFDDKLVEFTNAVKPVTLGSPFMETKTDNTTVRAYRVKGIFKIAFDFHKYPFGQQAVKISLRNTAIPRNRLIYVPDRLGMPRLEDIKNEIGKQTKGMLASWNVNAVLLYQDLVKKTVLVGKFPDNYHESDIDYSQFNAVLQMERKGFELILKSFLPIFIVAVMLYFTYYLPADRFGIRLMILVATSLTCGLHHFLLSRYFSVTYFLFIEYAFFSFYALTAMSLFFFLCVKHLLKKDAHKKIKYLTRAVKILYPPAVSLIAVLIAYTCYLR